MSSTKSTTASFAQAFLRVAIATVTPLLLIGCATAPQYAAIDTTDNKNGIFADRLYRAPAKPIDAQSIFAMSPEMTAFLKRDLAKSIEWRGPQHGLVDALYEKRQLKLEYDSKQTYTASEAFNARAGNCISLVIMTAAFARAMGTPVYYNEVLSEAYWSRMGDLHSMSGHVNLTIGRRIGQSSTATVRALSDDDVPLTIDFMRPYVKQNSRVRTLREATVIAMFFNNRAAELIVENKLDDAYWMAREAIVQDPRYLPALNTLALVYRRSKQPELAERVLNQLIAVEPKNVIALSNLSVAQRAQGKLVEASATEALLNTIDPHPPFYFFDEGVAAMRRKEYSLAIKHFEREAQRDAFYHEVHFWLAAAYAGHGNARAAQRHMTLALENSTSNDQKTLYSHKLSLIRASVN
jgi:Tfp pilus assembly protein PilF